MDDRFHHGDRAKPGREAVCQIIAQREAAMRTNPDQGNRIAAFCGQNQHRLAINFGLKSAVGALMPSRAPRLSR